MNYQGKEVEHLSFVAASEESLQCMVDNAVQDRMVLKIDKNRFIVSGKVEIHASILVLKKKLLVEG